MKGIWEISGTSIMLGYLRNLPNTQGIWEISQIPRHLRNFQNLKNIPPLNTYKNLGNFPNAWVSGKFPKCPGIWKISQRPGYLGNFSSTQAFEKFPKS